jgi:hypothetical protein
MAPKREQAPVVTPASIANGLQAPETALHCLSQLAAAAATFSEVRHLCLLMGVAPLHMQLQPWT